jgi:hypothetical protein
MNTTSVERRIEAAECDIAADEKTDHSFVCWRNESKPQEGGRLRHNVFPHDENRLSWLGGSKTGGQSSASSGTKSKCCIHCQHAKTCPIRHHELAPPHSVLFENISNADGGDVIGITKLYN